MYYTFITRSNVWVYNSIPDNWTGNSAIVNSTGKSITKQIKEQDNDFPFLGTMTSTLFGTPALVGNMLSNLTYWTLHNNRG